MHLFVEVFPLKPALAENITAYALHAAGSGAELDRLGRQIARRLHDAFGSHWIWVGEQLMTDVPRSDIELLIAVDRLRELDSERYGGLEAITALPSPEPRVQADFILRTHAEAHRTALNAALHSFNTTAPAGDTVVRFVRDYRLIPMVVDGAPACALTLSTRMIYGRDAAAFEKSWGSDALVGMRVSLPDARFDAEVLDSAAPSSTSRERLLKQKLPPELVRHVEAAPQDSPILKLRNTNGTLRLPAHGLSILLRPTDWPRINLESWLADPMLRPDPPTRAAMIRKLSEALKQHDLIDRAYASREYSALFHIPTDDDRPFLRFGDKRTREARPEHLARDLMQCGPFRLQARFQTQPLRAAVVNATGEKLDDFLEALRRMLGKQLAFQIEIAKERTVRVLSLHNLDSAVKVVEKESPDVVLFFLPDAEANLSEDYAQFVKDLTLGKGLPAHIVRRSSIDDPEAMPELIAAILARTGNTPAALADPIEGFDLVVGLDLARRTDDGRSYLVGAARIYGADGTFQRYAVREADITGDAPPYLLLRALFSQKAFSGKRVVLHVNGRLPDDIRAALKIWGQAIKTRFAIVEIIRRGAPRLYALDYGKISAPPVGCAFISDNSQAILVLTSLDDDTPATVPAPRSNRQRQIYLGATPQPVQIIAEGIGIRPALDSVQRFALLDYRPKPTGVPVTILNTDTLSAWLEQHGILSAPDGDAPFWL